MPHPSVPGDFVYFFHPRADTGQFPVIFFCQGIGESSPGSYGALIRHIVSKGFSVIYPSYAVLAASVAPAIAYSMLWDAIHASLSVPSWKSRMDTTRIGFVGHSYGGGAVPSIARTVLTKWHWGARGAFLHVMAPWYSYNISHKDLAAFPKNAYMVVEVFADDAVNDHRMAKDIFCTIGIPASHKAYITLYSDSANGFSLKADHNVPLGRTNGSNVDALDSWGVYRVFDALAGLAFDKDQDARQLLMENGERLLAMGEWFNGTPVMCMSVTKSPDVFRPQSFYRNFWAHAMNPRAGLFGAATPLDLVLLTPETVWNYYQHLIGKTD